MAKINPLYQIEEILEKILDHLLKNQVSHKDCCTQIERMQKIIDSKEDLISSILKITKEKKNE